MPHAVNSIDEKFEGFDIWKIRNLAESLTSVQELKDIPEMLKAVQKYLREEEKEARESPATKSFAYHLHLDDSVITKDLTGTTIYNSKQALNEIKFDIIVDNWTFSTVATGLIFLVKAHEMAY